MPLVKKTLETEIASILKEMREKKEPADDLLAQKLATAIDNYLKTMTVTVSGVTTTGTAAAQTQTAPVVAKIS